MGSADAGCGGIQPDCGRSPSVSQAKPILRRPPPFRLLKGSADLTAWNVIASVTNLTGTVEFAGPDAVLSTQRFYRVKAEE